MCGRVVEPEVAALERFWAIDRNNWNPFDPPRYNIPPTAQVPIVLIARDGQVEMTGARWGLIPFWWKDEKLPPLTFNARSEEAATKPMWRGPLKTQRCLMPIRGWYEWNENEPARNPAGKPCNQPYYHYNPDEPVLGVAGIWSAWQAPGGNSILSCALLSKAAAPSVAFVHHRMPVILPASLYDDWLDPAATPAQVEEMIAAARGDFSAYRVSTHVNSTKSTGLQLLTGIDAA